MTAIHRATGTGATGWVGRLLGADPVVFGTFVRAYGLIVRRRSRMRFGRGVSRGAMGRISPFHLACATAALVGVGIILVVGTIRPPILGALAAMTLGLFIVAFAVLFDYLEVLVQPDEYRVIAAHPHDAWSVVSAKVFVVGRAVATLALCYFTPSVVAVGFFHHSLLPSVAFALGAAFATIAASLGAMLLGVGILARWGRVALLRFLPAMQAAFLIAYFSMSMVRRWLVAGGHSLGTALPAWLAFLPSAWFLAPLEWATGATTTATWLRAALAFGSVVGLVVAGANWRRSGFGESLLGLGDGANPSAGGRGSSSRAAPAAANRDAGARSKRRRSWVRDPATRAFLSMARIHARADLAFRSQMIISLMMPAMMFLSPSISLGARRQAFPEFVLLFASGAAGFAIMTLIAASAASTRPEAFWPVLASPVSRERYSMAPRGVLRWGLVLPVVLAAGAWYMATAAGVPWHERIARVAGVALYLELLVTLQRGIAPDPPFTVRPNRDRRLQWGQVLAMLVGFAICAGGAVGLGFLWLVRGWGAWVAFAVLGVWRVPVEFWTRWRVRRAWESLEAA
ncbi:MAG TPA: hypothetical protein VFU59_03315 [Candidatus Eisenbacteria bacterium]|nr:hypothetical protein [Candidatus Eisenbacteria bacterium]